MLELQLLHDATQATTTVLAADGIIDTVQGRAVALQGLLRVIASVCSVGFVIYQAISSRGAMARILISGLAAGVFVWIVFNVTELSDRVDNEVNAAGVAATGPQLQPRALLAPHAAAGGQHTSGV